MRIALCAIPLLVFVLISPAHGQKKPRPDFSGEWELVKEKSDFGKMSPPVNMKLLSEKKDGYLHSVQTTETPEGDKVLESEWYPDGKRHTISKPVPGYTLTHWDDDTLVSEQRSDDGHYRQTVRLSMQANGKEAVEIVDSHTPSGDNHMRLVWRRRQ
jgi:hypothetical protein